MKRHLPLLVGTSLGLLAGLSPVAAMATAFDNPKPDFPTLSDRSAGVAPLILAQGEQNEGLTRRNDNDRRRQLRLDLQNRARADAERARRQENEREERRAEEREENEQRERAEREPRREEGRKARERDEREPVKKADRDRERQRERREAREREENAARREAKDEVRKEAERNARRTVEREARERAENQARREAEGELRRKAEREARREIEREAKERAQAEARQADRVRREAIERDALESAREDARRRAEREAIRQAEDEADAARRAAERVEEERERVARRAARQAEEFAKEEALREDNRRRNREARYARLRQFDSYKRFPADRELPEANPETPDLGPLPQDDLDVQQGFLPRGLTPFTNEGGRRDDRPFERRNRERPQGTEVLRDLDDRLIVRFGDRVVVESSDGPRLARGAREVFTEELPSGRTRETIVRENGVRIVTLRNVYGDVLRRSRIPFDGPEQVLSYVDEADYGLVRDRGDPGQELPPLQIELPEEDYILDAEPSQQDYYEFLDQPPIEKVQRLYSLDEVKRSARVRDIARRVDLSTINFPFGSASILASDLPRLEGVAVAIKRLLLENPGETFLIEGHTDAVGGDLDNLSLSDRRAEAVAQAMTDVFGIPAENLATQGYGEEFLKVDAEGPARENRRVAIRRITALVSPVAFAQ